MVVPYRAQRVLLATTSAIRLGDTEQPGGVWLDEVAVPYYRLRKAGYLVGFASIKGGPIPIDPGSITAEAKRHPLLGKFLHDIEARALLNTSQSVVHVFADDFDALLVVGGYGIAWDGTYNSELKRLIEDAMQEDKVVAAIGYGPAALMNACQANGKSIVEGKQVTALSNREVREAGKTHAVPFLIETKLQQVGGLYTRSRFDWAPFAVRAGNMVTGQNPASAALTTEHIVEALSLGVRLTP